MNSYRVKPESYGTLKEITDVLRENAELKVLILDHTESDGIAEIRLEVNHSGGENWSEAVGERRHLSRLPPSS